MVGGMSCLTLTDKAGDEGRVGGLLIGLHIRGS